MVISNIPLQVYILDPPVIWADHKLHTHDLGTDRAETSQVWWLGLCRDEFLHIPLIDVGKNTKLFISQNAHTFFYLISDTFMGDFFYNGEGVEEIIVTSRSFWAWSAFFSLTNWAASIRTGAAISGYCFFSWAARLWHCSPLNYKSYRYFLEEQL